MTALAIQIKQIIGEKVFIGIIEQSQEMYTMPGGRVTVNMGGQNVLVMSVSVPEIVYDSSTTILVYLRGDTRSRDMDSMFCNKAHFDYVLTALRTAVNKVYSSINNQILVDSDTYIFEV